MKLAVQACHLAPRLSPRLSARLLLCLAVSLTTVAGQSCSSSPDAQVGDVNDSSDAASDESTSDTNAFGGSKLDGAVADANIADASHDAARSDANRPDTAIPDATSPDATSPDATSPDATNPDAGNPAGLTHAALLTRRSGFAETVTGAGTDADANTTKHVWVTTLADAGAGSLRAALSQPNRWVRFDDSLGDAFTITLTSGTIVPAANITLDGRGKHPTIRSTHSGTVFGINNDNQIFVNLEIVVAASGQNIQADCFNINGGNASPVDDVWIHHVTMSGARDKRVGVPFGADVTIDWCHMYGNTGHGVLVGCKTCTRPDVSFTTMHHNYMQNLPDRYPRVSDGHHAHAYNNVSENWAYYAMGAVRSAELLAENNWFIPGGDDTAIKASEGSNAKGFVKATGNVLNGGTEEQNAPNMVFQPPYAYTAETANIAMRDRVIAESGWQPASFWQP